MGRIRTTRKHGCILVTVEGRLSAADMGRLEHACSQELTSRAPHLEIDLTRVTSFDETAVAVLGRIAERGAVLRTASPATERC
jgi:anti-anti-sigma regulatory factor